MFAGRRLAVLILVAAVAAFGLVRSAPASAASCAKAMATGLDQRYVVPRLVKATQIPDDPRGSTLRSFPLTSVTCAQLTRGGPLELVTRRSGPTASSPDAVAVYRLRAGRYRPVLVYADNTVATPTLHPPGEVRVTEALLAATDPNCCPSRVRDIAYRWDGARFVRHVLRIRRPG